MARVIKLGDVIIVKGVLANGHDEQPAIVTCVHSQDYINCKVIPDCEPSVDVTSVHVFPSQGEAETFLSIHSTTEYPLKAAYYN